jgi:glutamate---cysteine ligase / carboxylate-amine ligase
MEYNFSSDELNFGVEEEFFIVDKKGNMAPAFNDIYEKIPPVLRTHKVVYYELHKSQLEINSGICSEIDDANEDILFMRGMVHDKAKELGLSLAGMGTHPFGDWKKSRINPQYARNLVRRKQHQAYMTSGLHIHISVSKSKCVKVLNALRYFTPVLIPVAANSPFYTGKLAGYQDYRLKIIELAHTLDKKYAGLTPTMHRLNDWLKLYSSRNIPMYWDFRPNFKYGTIETRLFDSQPSIKDTISIVSMLRTLVGMLIDRNIGIPVISENNLEHHRQSAIRKGFDGNFAGESIRNYFLKNFIPEIMEWADEYGASHKAIKHAAMKARKNLAQEQVDIFRRKNINSIVKDFSKRFLK